MLEAEFLDAPDAADRLVAHSHGYMRWVNRYWGGTRAVCRLVAEELAHKPNAAGAPAGRPLRVLDLGSGSADIPLVVSRWARTRGRIVEFTCLERSPHAVRIAQERVARAADPHVHILEADALEYQPDKPYDWAVGSMFFHHLTDAQILALVAHLRGFVRRGVFLNDLRRSALTYAGCLMTAPLLSAGVRHDALLSIRRGFRPKELENLLGAVEGAAVSVAAAWFGRVTATIRFQHRGENA